LICEGACDWRSCDRNCPKAEIWSELFKASGEINSLNRKRILDSAANCLGEIVGLGACAIKALGDEGAPPLIAVHGMREEDLKSLAPGAEEEAIRQRKCAIFDLMGSPFAVVPISFRGRALGIIYAKLGPGSPGAALPFIRAMADCIGAALENERRYRIAIGNWHEAVKELWSKMDVWKSSKELPAISKGV